MFAQICLTNFFVSLQRNSLSIAIESSDSVWINIFFQSFVVLIKLAQISKFLTMMTTGTSSLQDLDVVSLLARLYISTGRAIAVTTAEASMSASMSASALLKMLMFWLKFLKACIS